MTRHHGDTSVGQGNFCQQNLGTFFYMNKLLSCLYAPTRGLSKDATTGTALC